MALESPFSGRLEQEVFDTAVHGLQHRDLEFRVLAFVLFHKALLPPGMRAFP